MDQPAAWGLVRWLARKAGVDVGELNPHSLRHRFVTAALNAGVSLRDVQDAAGHAAPYDPPLRPSTAQPRPCSDYAVTACLASGTDAPRVETKSEN